MACEEASYIAMDPLGKEKGDHARSLISKCFQDRDNTTYNVHRLTVVGRKPMGLTENVSRTGDTQDEKAPL